MIYAFTIRRRLYLGFLCLLLLITLHIILRHTLNNFETHDLDNYRIIIQQHQQQQHIQNSVASNYIGCKAPHLDPWDPLIKAYIKHPKDLSCDQVQPFLTYIDDNGYLTLNQTELKILAKSTNSNFTCLYWTFDRTNDTEDGLSQHSEARSLSKPVKLETDFVEVECKTARQEEDEEEGFYWNLHAHPCDQKINKSFVAPTENQLSVLFLILDSVSFSAMQRNLPLTYNYTSNVMGMKYFKVFNKIGDNSFPNVMAMLMGKRVKDDQDDMRSDMPGYHSFIQYDSWPLIWKRYSDQGYATVFNEDNPQVGLFHFDGLGFAKKPVDYYYHTFWTMLKEDSDFERTCFRNEPKSRLVLDITRRHAITMNKRLQFVFTSTMELSHDNDNQVELLDNDFYSFWKQIYEGGDYLNKSVVIFASDHGLRTGSIRKTLIGLLEERLPFFGIWFPSWFYNRHPALKNHIEANTEILSSSFDVYETLVDIADGNFHGRQRSSGQRGQSQLYPLPLNRTCKMAGVPDHYCVCLTETPLAINDTLTLEAASFLVHHLNDMLTKKLADLCHVIELKKVLFARFVDVEEKVKNDIRTFEEAREHDMGIQVRKIGPFHIEIKLGVETWPNNATFEATLRKPMTGHTRLWSVWGMVSRTSMYKGLSDCTEDKILRMYCSCK